MRGCVAVLAVLAACTDQPDVRRTGRADAPPDRAAARREAAELGRDVFDLVDRAMSYKSSHRGRLARTLPELGIDTLTPATVRRMSTGGGTPTVTVAFRRTGGRALASCSGTSAVLEEASLDGNRFSVVCTDVTGAIDTYQVTR